MAEKLQERAEILVPRRVGYDVDDTLVWRDEIARFLGRLKSQKIHKLSLADLPILDHTPVNKGGVEPVQYFFQKGRGAIPGALDLVTFRHASGDEQFAITGRPATTQWHDATVAQLQREGFPIPKDRVVLTPLGIKTYMSKAVAIRDLKIEEYSDDDLRAILINAFIHPEVTFNWIQHSKPNTNVNEVVLAARSNVRVRPIASWARRIS